MARARTMMQALAAAASLLLFAVFTPAARADGNWTCGAQTGWLSANGQRVDSPRIGTEPCATAQADAAGASGSPGSLSASGSLIVDGGAAAQTTDARRPQAAVQAKSLTIQSSDGKLVLNASNLTSQALAQCDTDRQPLFTSGGSPGTVTLDGRPVDTSKDYSEPGVGVNGAPLFGKITIHFNELVKDGNGLTRRALHLIVTDRNGAVVFEAVAGETAVGRDGDVCAPPPVCPPGQEPRAGRCVDISVTPLPQPPPPAPQLPAPIGGAPGNHPKPVCRDADARPGRVSPRRLGAATLCLLNLERKRHHTGRLRSSADLGRAAARHARDMVRRRYFSHTEPGGLSVVERILRSGYLGRYGRWRIGENLGWGWGSGATPRAMVAAWMHSPDHRRNILDRAFHDIGVAVVGGGPRRKRSRSLTYVTDFGGFQLLG